MIKINAIFKMEILAFIISFLFINLFFLKGFWTSFLLRIILVWKSIMGEN